MIDISAIADALGIDMREAPPISQPSGWNAHLTRGIDRIFADGLLRATLQQPACGAEAAGHAPKKSRAKKSQPIAPGLPSLKEYAKWNTDQFTFILPIGARGPWPRPYPKLHPDIDPASEDARLYCCSTNKALILIGYRPWEAPCAHNNWSHDSRAAQHDERELQRIAMIHGPWFAEAMAEELAKVGFTLTIPQRRQQVATIMTTEETSDA